MSRCDGDDDVAWARGEWIRGWMAYCREVRLRGLETGIFQCLSARWVSILTELGNEIYSTFLPVSLPQLTSLWVAYLQSIQHNRVASPIRRRRPPNDYPRARLQSVCVRPRRHPRRSTIG